MDAVTVSTFITGDLMAGTGQRQEVAGPKVKFTSSGLGSQSGLVWQLPRRHVAQLQRSLGG